MCMMCDGASRDETLFHTDAVIARHGWMVLAVADHPPTPEWAYTIGLATTFDHPELVIVGERHTDAARAINELGERIRSGERFDAGIASHRGHDEVEFVEVHPIHIERGLVNQWIEYFGALGPPYPDLSVLQVLLPGPYCHKHQHQRPRLDTADDVMHLAR